MNSRRNLSTSYSEPSRVRSNPLTLARPDRPKDILQKVLTGTSPLLAILQLIPDVTVTEIPSGCCGMAGAFGHEKEHYDISLAVGEDRLFPAVRAASPETIIAATGTSCRQHIFDGTGRWAVHSIVILAEALAS
jgi:Fe-S oxidoreductase